MDDERTAVPNDNITTEAISPVTDILAGASYIIQHSHGFHIGQSTSITHVQRYCDCGDKLLGESLVFERFCRKEADVFVVTKGYWQIIKTLRQHKTVTVLGRSGVGKTQSAYWVALAQAEEEFHPLQASTAQEALDFCKTACHAGLKVCIVIDDLFGGSYLVPNSVDEWAMKGKLFEPYLLSGSVTLVVTCRNTIWNECVSKLPRFSLFEHKVDLNFEELAFDERMQILEKHLTKVNFAIPLPILKKAISYGSPLGFPECCRLLCTEEAFLHNPEEFFRGPTVILEKMISNMSTANPWQYAALVLAMMRNGFLSKVPPTCLPVTKELTALLKACGIFDTTDHSYDKLYAAANLLKGTYFEEKTSGMILSHESLKETLAFEFGRKNPHLFLKLCDKSLALQVIRVTDSQDSADLEHRGFVVLNSTFYRDLACIITQMILDGNLSVFAIPTLSSYEFQLAWVDFLKGDKRAVALLVSDNLTGESVLFQAVLYAHQPLVEYLLRQRANLNQYLDYRHPVLAAARSGHLSMTTLILNEGEIPQEILIKGFIIAASNGNISVVKCFLKALRDVAGKVAVSTIEESLLGCSLSGQTEVVKFFIGEGLLPTEQLVLKDAITRAAKMDHVEITVLLLGHINRDHKGSLLAKAIAAAAIGGKMKTLEYALSHCPEIQSQNLDNAVVNAAFAGHCDFVKSLWENALSRISQHGVNTAFIKAAQHGHIHIVEYLHSRSLIILETVPEALIKSATSDDISVLVYLLNEWYFSNETLNGAFICAASRSHSHALSVLAEYGGEFTQKSIDDALVNASSNQIWANVDFLLHTNPPPKEEAMVTALKVASQKGSTLIFSRLFDYVPTQSRPRALAECLREACQKGNSTIVIHILNLSQLGDTFSPMMIEAIHDSFVTAASVGSTHILHLLQQKSVVIPTEIIARSIIGVSRNGHLNVLTYLLNIPLAERSNVLMHIHDMSCNEMNSTILTCPYFDPTPPISVFEFALAEASYFGHGSIVDRLLRSFPVNDLTFKLVYKAVLEASGQGFTELVRYFMDTIPPASLSQELIGEILLRACSGGHVSIIKMLLEGNIKPPRSSYEEAFKIACLGRNVEVTGVLFTAYASSPV